MKQVVTVLRRVMFGDEAGSSTATSVGLAPPMRDGDLSVLRTVFEDIFKAMKAFQAAADARALA